MKTSFGTPRSHSKESKTQPSIQTNSPWRKHLIDKSTSKFDLGKYKDDYEAAVKKMVEAKRKGRPLVEEEVEAPRPKVVNIMDALRDSLAETRSRHKPTKKSTCRRKAGAVPAHRQYAEMHCRYDGLNP